MPTAWLIQVDQTRRRAHGEPDTPGEVELCRGDSFLIIWEDDGWTLFERYPGDVAAWTTTVMPEGTEVSHHNHILLPSQRVYDGDVPPAEDPNASSSQARGHHSGGSTPHKAAPPRPPSSSTSSGNRSEKAWASEDGGDQQEEMLAVAQLVEMGQANRVEWGQQARTVDTGGKTEQKERRARTPGRLQSVFRRHAGDRDGRRSFRPYKKTAQCSDEGKTTKGDY
ncbi:hypothetical protein AK812_SmicGene45572 [Symbiodinium microadriaticum]|uniref:Uncharacterized protein n=1 Tax=Symbiodinium microadriaticum TaxID=2951 RepID=A0A1Q9BVR0_SYMMI|nr:hypothetical protein AK812_SmicGene45572 [Symbiodinium microadriaticum]